jgi:hypothetical protein
MENIKPHRIPHPSNKAALSANCSARTPMSYIANLRLVELERLQRQRKLQRNNAARKQRASASTSSRPDTQGTRSRGDTSARPSETWHENGSRRRPDKRSSSGHRTPKSGSSSSAKRPRIDDSPDLPSDIDQFGYKIPPNHSKFKTLTEARKNFHCANGKPNDRWIAKEEDFIRNLLTGDVFRTGDFPLLTETDRLERNEARFGKDRLHKYKSLRYFQEKYDRENWNLFRKNLAKQTWDTILNGTPFTADESESSDDDSSVSTDNTTPLPSKDLDGQNEN